MGTAANWVARARGKRIDRVQFESRKPGRAWNRTPGDMEQLILSVRNVLRKESVLGEYGPDAIGLALQYGHALDPVPLRMTIYRVLARHGVLDGAHRQRRPAPPKGWYLPDLACGRAELDSFDFIEDLKIAGGPPVDVLVLHGTYETLNVGRQIGRARRQKYSLHSGLLQRDPECLRELRVAIHEQVLLPAQESIFGVGQIPGGSAEYLYLTGAIPDH